MAGGFDFNALLQDPMFMIGLGLMAQQQQPGEGRMAGLGRGVAQGLGNLNTVQQIEQRRAVAEQQQKALAMRNQLVENIRNRAQKPRPLAMEPQPGDDQIRQNYDEQNMIADIIAAGGSPDTYLARTMQREQAAAEGARKSEESRLTREERARQFEQTLAERQLSREELTAYRNASLEQAKALREASLSQARALHGALSQNASPVQIVGPDGQPMYVHPSQAYGKSPVAKTPSINVANEQKRQSAIAALDFADQELAKLDQKVQQSPRTVGPLGVVRRGMEAATGTLYPSVATPAIDVRNEQMNILATIRKRLTDANASNRDIAQALEIIGGGMMTTPGATRRSITTLRQQLRSQREAMGKAAPGGGGLTPAEQQELEALRKQFPNG